MRPECKQVRQCSTTFHPAGIRPAGRALAAAVVNAIVVLFLPLMAIALLALGSPHADSVTVHPPGWAPWLAALRSFLRTATPMAPFALLAAWRTWVHARRWRERDRDSRGVAEAAACGLTIAPVVLAPGILTSPLKALPYVVLYGGLGLVVGMAVGLLLHVTAVVVLTVSERGMNL